MNQAIQITSITTSLLAAGGIAALSLFDIPLLASQPADRALPLVRWLFSRGSHIFPQAAVCFLSLSLYTIAHSGSRALRFGISFDSSCSSGGCTHYGLRLTDGPTVPLGIRFRVPGIRLPPDRQRAISVRNPQVAAYDRVYTRRSPGSQHRAHHVPAHGTPPHLLSPGFDGLINCRTDMTAAMQQFCVHSQERDPRRIKKHSQRRPEAVPRRGRGPVLRRGLGQ